MTTKAMAQMVEMRNKGATYQEIGDKFGITRQYAHKIINKIIKKERAGLNPLLFFGGV